MLDGKSLVLGIGAQRCGTTWLFNYLRTLEGAAHSAIKELHFFDSWLEPARFTRFDPWFVDLLARGLTNGGVDALDRPLVGDLLDRVRAIRYPRAYLELLDRRADNGARAALDFTPSYSLLTEESYRRMRAYFADHDVAVKFVFVMRDPVDRYHSALRMQERELKPRGIDFSAIDEFDRQLSEPHFHERTRYDWTIQRLLGVFPRSAVYFTFYEHLFDEAALKAVCDFTGLTYAPADGHPPRNVALAAGELTQAQVDNALSTFEPVYRACRELFGDGLPTVWRA